MSILYSSQPIRLKIFSTLAINDIYSMQLYFATSIFCTKFSKAHHFKILSWYYLLRAISSLILSNRQKLVNCWCQLVTCVLRKHYQEKPEANILGGNRDSITDIFHEFAKIFRRVSFNNIYAERPIKNTV